MVFKVAGFILGFQNTDISHYARIGFFILAVKPYNSGFLREWVLSDNRMSVAPDEIEFYLFQSVNKEHYFNLEGEHVCQNRYKTTKDIHK